MEAPNGSDRYDLLARSSWKGPFEPADMNRCVSTAFLYFKKPPARTTFHGVGGMPRPGLCRCRSQETEILLRPGACRNEFGQSGETAETLKDKDYQCYFWQPLNIGGAE